jgi:hypothetical protein
MVTDSRQDRLARLPPRGLPLLYFGVARAAFVTALLLLALDPMAGAGNFYHPRMLALVHLVTLGWLTCSIYASFYIVGPLALRINLAAGPMDHMAFGLTAAGLTGAIAAFWQNDPAAAGWWGSLVLPTAVLLGARGVAALRRSPVQSAVTWHIGLAFLNLLLAGALGIVLGIDRTQTLITAPRLAAVYAHAHLAAIGWVGLMAVGVGYRLFPMVLPAAMPEGRSLYASVILLQGGTVALVAGFLLSLGRLVPAGALLVAAGFVAFLCHVRRMLQQPRPAPVALRQPDYGAWQALASLLFLATAIVMGLYLSIQPASDWTLRLALAYGVLGLIGFFSQLVAGMEYRILPFFAWYWAFANTDFKGPSPTPYEMPVPGLQRASFVLWAVAVPMLAAGMTLAQPRWIALGAWLLLAAVVIGGVDAATIASRAFRR